MDAKELRIGNNLDFEGAICGVKEIDSAGVKVLFKDGEEIWIDLFQLGPVPINNRVLNKIEDQIISNRLGCGFEKGKLKLYLSDQWSFDCEYLHQLQNLYFALTNKELIYNPK